MKHLHNGILCNPKKSLKKKCYGLNGVIYNIYIGKRTRKASYKSVYNVLALVYKERKCKIYIVFAYCCMMKCRRNEPEINENGGKQLLAYI